MRNPRLAPPLVPPPLMTNPLRGEIWQAQVNPAGAPELRILVVVLSHDQFNQSSPAVLIAPVVPQREAPKADYPCHVLLSRAAVGVDEEMLVIAEQTRPILKQRLQGLVARLDPASQERLGTALRAVLDLN